MWLSRIFINGEQTNSGTLELFLFFCPEMYKRKQKVEQNRDFQTGFDLWSIKTHWVCQKGRVNKLKISTSELRMANCSMFLLWHKVYICHIYTLSCKITPVQYIDTHTHTHSCKTQLLLYTGIFKQKITPHWLSDWLIKIHARATKYGVLQHITNFHQYPHLSDTAT